MSTPSSRHRANERLAAWYRAKPWRVNYWRAVDEVRAARAQEWPRHTFVPLRRTASIVAKEMPRHGYMPSPEVLAHEACNLAGYAAWRVTQGVFRFDPTLATALALTPLTGDLPVTALTHLPHWCTYIETPGRTMPKMDGNDTALHGFFAWTNWHGADEPVELMLGMDTERPYPELPVSVVPLVGTLEESIRAVQTSWEESYASGLVQRGPSAGFIEGANRRSPLISLLLYLCADDAEIGDGATRPAKPLMKKTTQGWRLFPPQTATAWDVGVRIGAAIRHAEQRNPSIDHLAGERSRPRAHIRRAHWATYWTGSRSGEQTPVVRWLPPIPVNVEDVEAMPVTVRPVESR